LRRARVPAGAGARRDKNDDSGVPNAVRKLGGVRHAQSPASRVEQSRKAAAAGESREALLGEGK